MIYYVYECIRYVCYVFSKKMGMQSIIYLEVNVYLYSVYISTVHKVLGDKLKVSEIMFLYSKCLFPLKFCI